MGNRLWLAFYLNLLAINGWLCAQSVTLEWDPSADPVVGYNIYRSLQSGGDYARINRALIRSTRYTDTPIQYDVRYYYVCRAVNLLGLESGPSNEVSVVRARPNSPPTANNVTASTQQGQAVTIDVTANDRDGDGDALTVISVTQPANGTAAIVSASIVRYTPNAGFRGTDSFTFIISDGNGGTASATVTVTVGAGVNRPLHAADDHVVTVKNLAVTINVLANDSDPDGDHVELVSHSIPAHGTARVIGHGLIRYVPDPGFVGVDSFTYRVTDGQAFAKASVSVEVLDEVGGYPSFFFPTTLETGSPLLRETFVGLGFLNPGPRPNGVELTVLEETGQTLAEGSILPTLPPGGQSAFLTDELVGPGLNASHLSARGLVGAVQGCFVIGDYGLRRMDGVGAQLVDGVDLVLPEIRESALETTLILAINPSTEDPARVDFELVEESGRVLARVDRRVPPQGMVRDSVGGLFGTDLAEGYVRLRSDRPVRGIAVVADRESLVTASGRPPRPVERLWAPHFYAGGVGSILKVVNAGGQPATVRIWAYDDGGHALGSHIINVPARGFRLVRSEVVTPVPPGGLVTGYLVLAPTEPAPIVATMTFLGGGGRARTLIPLTDRGQREILFPHVVQTADGAIFTGLALLNLDQSSGVAIVEAYDSQGKRTQSKKILLGSRSRRADLLRSETFFGPAFEQVGGHLRISANVPVAAYITFGDSAGEFLSVVEPQEEVRRE